MNFRLQRSPGGINPASGKNLAHVAAALICSRHVAKVSSLWTITRS